LAAKIDIDATFDKLFGYGREQGKVMVGMFPDQTMRLHTEFSTFSFIPE
jgi:hypothetical protein